METGEQQLIASYTRWRSGGLGQITEALEEQLLLEMLGPVTGKTLLDVGCGDGALIVQLAQQDAVVTGLDSDPTMLAAARRRAETANVQLRLVEGKAQALPFPDASFDRVLAVTALCFIPDVERAIGEMTRVLKPGGLLIIGELNSHSLWAAYRRMRGWFGHPLWRPARFRSPAELRRLVSQAGLDVLEMRGAAYYPPCGAAARLLAPVDSWLGRRTTLGAAFIALSAAKPAFFPNPGDAASSLRREALSPTGPPEEPEFLRALDSPPAARSGHAAIST
ncbi:MAG: class I SAM-dependent methyltransferase [Hyphomicrobiales bacterium]|jgi:ubiquinone/menaquinone biosynthesis C-methylase UbiE|nr:MAG: class I SAM-dependent methyltransferase [Hyphomicrobiales bacterium]